MKLFIGLIALMFLASCVPPGENQTVLCETPYQMVNGACCLDKNANSICDKDETQRADVVVRERPVILVQETCNMPRFTCLSKELTSDYVRLNLRFDRNEIATVKKITLTELGCSADFNATLKFGDSYEFTVPCAIEDDAFKAEVLTEAQIQPILRHSNGQIYDYGTATPALLKGEIGGAVR